MKEMIRVERLSKRYDGFSLSDFNLTVNAGYIVGLIGSNGAGKTTLIKAITGMVAPDSGTVRLLGEPPCDSGAAMDKIRQRIGIVLDTCAFPVTMRISDVGSLGRAAYKTWDVPLFEQLCSRFALSNKKMVKDLSRGMGMKLTLAFALAHHPDLLILDEATAGLDPMARDEILDILRSFMAEEGHAILMSTHITTDLEKVADEVVCIDGGRAIFALEKERITDVAGIAHCRESDLEAVRLSADSPLKAIRRGFGTDVLVPDRAAFAKAHPSISMERISIEDYMALMLKGETL